MHRNNSKRKIVIYSLLGVLLLMTVGYASFQSSLKIKGTSKVSSLWDVEITNVTSGISIGSAENGKDENGNVVLPSWDKLNASISADLYESGDSMTYIVTIENKGTLDAKIDDIIPSQNSGNDNIVSNDGVKITFSGYTKGQMLYKSGQSGSKMDITVKVEYNDEYTGGPTSLETNLQFNFVQAESKEVDEGEVISENSHKVTYDYISNGGDKKTYERYYQEGEEIDLTIGTDEKYDLKNEYILLGWNTDGGSTEKLETLTMENSNIHLYAIYKEDNIVINSINTTSTTNSITVVVDALADSGIKKIEYSNDDGDTWEESTESEDIDIHTITSLVHDTDYPIKVRAISNTNKKTEQLKEDNSCNIEEGRVYNFDYTGGEQTFTAPCRGTYTFEAWGAQGGDTKYSVQYYGGKGGYTKGDIILSENKILYTYVGGKGGTHNGTTTDSPSTEYTGYNGGSKGNFFSGNSNAGGGGGATDFRLINGIWNDFEGLKSRIMVAGGGGGSDSHIYSPSWSGNGGSAGGLIGEETQKANNDCYYYGTGGTQTSGGNYITCPSYNTTITTSSSGKFGIGGSNLHSGGGGGYYGGGGGTHTSAAGGSSFISGHNGCDAIKNSSDGTIIHSGQNVHYSGYKFTNTIMKAGNEVMTAPSGGTETGHTGNGHARITFKTNNKNIFTNKIDAPIFVENSVGKVTITYLQDCTKYICTYKIDSNNEIVVNSNNINLNLSDGSVITGYVKDKNNDEIVNIVSSTYSVILNTDCVVNKVWNYSYKGEYQTFDPPCTGTYKLETWGAQGGNATYINTTYNGGKGGYSSGTKVVSSKQRLYIYVGGQGQSSTGGTSTGTGDSSIGYNGGGYGCTYTSNSAGGGGGGATHIATTKGLLKDLSDKKENVIIVAGAGGGGRSHTANPNYSGEGGVGGGLSGGNGVNATNYCYSLGLGGTQSGPGAHKTCSSDGHAYNYKEAGFGYGANLEKFSSANVYSGGGSGYYGGAAGSHAPGGGGSSYIGGVNDGKTIAGNSAMPAYTGSSTITGNTGNGYAKITLVNIE